MQAAAALEVERAGCAVLRIQAQEEVVVCLLDGARLLLQLCITLRQGAVELRGKMWWQQRVLMRLRRLESVGRTK